MQHNTPPESPDVNPTAGPSAKRTRFWVGLGMLTVAAAGLVLGVAFLWGTQYFWGFQSLLIWAPAGDDTAESFEAYIKERDDLEKAVAAKRDTLLEEALHAWTPKDDQGQARKTSVFALWKARQRWDGEDRAALAAKHRAALTHKREAEQQRALNRQGWVLSVVATLVLLLVSGVVACLGLRLLRTAAMPGTCLSNRDPELSETRVD